MQRGINHTRKLFVFGNPCKVNALFKKGAHPRPRFLEESSVHLDISGTIGKAKETKTTEEANATIVNTIGDKRKRQQQTNTFRPMSANLDMGLTCSMVLIICFGILNCFSMVFDSVCLDLFGCFGFFGFPYGFWCLGTFALYV